MEEGGKENKTRRLRIRIRRRDDLKWEQGSAGGEHFWGWVRAKGQVTTTQPDYGYILSP